VSNPPALQVQGPNDLVLPPILLSAQDIVAAILDVALQTNIVGSSDE